MPAADGPQLLDVVPWSYGFAHAWALGWMLCRPALAERILTAVQGLHLPAPWAIEHVTPEAVVKRTRADLRIDLSVPDGTLQVAVEVKVNDAVRRVSSPTTPKPGSYRSCTCPVSRGS